MRGLLHLTKSRARGFGRVTLLVYAGVLALLSFAHHCEPSADDRSAAVPPAGAGQVLIAATDHTGPDAPCIACSWQRSTAGALLLVPSRIGAVADASESLNPFDPALPGGCRLPHTSRGPPLS